MSRGGRRLPAVRFTRRYRIGLLASVLVASLLFVGPASAAPGDLDPTFDGDGFVTTDVTAIEGQATTHSEDFASDVALQADGKLVAVGQTAEDQDGSAGAVVRYNPDGSLDTTFGGGDGVEVLNEYVLIRALAIQPDGKMLLAGVDPLSALVMRLNSDGTVDPTFATDGSFTYGSSSVWAQFREIELTADGKIVVIGDQQTTAGEDWLIVRLLSDGSSDTSFGNNGAVTTSFGGDRERTADLAVYPDGKIVVTGQTERVESSLYRTVFATVRYNADGTLDPTFSDDGIVLTSLWDTAPTTNWYDYAEAVAIDADGNVVVGGSAMRDYNSDSYAFGIVRYTPNGSLDPSFGGDGIVTVNLEDQAPAADYLKDLLILPTGEIVAAGILDAYTPNHPDWGVVVLNEDGSLDPGFSSDGKHILDISRAQDTFGSYFELSMLRDSEGRLVLAGNVGAPCCDFALARMTGPVGTAPQPTPTPTPSPTADAPVAGENESVTANAAAGETVTTDPANDGANADDPVETTIVSPVPGTITIEEGPITETAPSLFQFFGQQVNITAPVASAADPLVFTFRLDSSAVPPGETKDTVQVFRNGARVPTCTATDGSATPDPCISSRVGYGDGDIGFTVRTSRASAWNFGVQVPDNSPPPPAPGPNPAPTPTPTPTVEPTNPPTGEETAAATGVHIRYAKAFGGFKGSVDSEEVCLANRKIRLKKVVPGPDKVRGRALTNDLGRWRIAKPSARGRFYAVALETTVTVDDTTTIVCMRGRSEILRMGR